MGFSPLDTVTPQAEGERYTPETRGKHDRGRSREDTYIWESFEGPRRELHRIMRNRWVKKSHGILRSAVLRLLLQALVGLIKLNYSFGRIRSV